VGCIRSKLIKEKMMMGSIRLCASVMILMTSTSFAFSQTIEELTKNSNAIQPFYCESTSGEKILYIFTPLDAKPDSELMLLPHRVPARRVGEVYSADLDDGTISVRDGAFVALTSTEIFTGKCEPFNHELLSFLEAMLVANPAALDTLATLTSVRKYANLTEIANAQVTKANAQVTKYANLIEIANAQIEKLKTEAAEKIPVSDPSTRRNARLIRENDRLKKKICELDPNVTFPVCQQSSQP
jgi:hypothetical protein